MNDVPTNIPQFNIHISDNSEAQMSRKKNLNRLSSLQAHLIPISNTVAAGELLRLVVFIQQPNTSNHASIDSIVVYFYGILEFYDQFEELHIRKIAEATRFLSINDFSSPNNSKEKQINTSLLIPTNAPTIFDSGYTFALMKSVNYYTEIQVLTAGETYTDRKQIYILKPKYSIFTTLDQPFPTFHTSLKVNNLSHPSGKIVGTLKIPSQNVKFGQVLPCSVTILNCFRKIKAELRLVEKILRIDDRPPKSHLFTKIVIISKRITSQKVEDTAWVDDNLDIWIPDESWRYKLPGTISLGVYLQLKIHVFMSSSTIAECPVFLHTPEKMSHLDQEDISHSNHSYEFK